MRRLLVLLLVLVSAFATAALVGSATPANAYGYACAIQDPPPSPFRVGSYMKGSTRTICQTPAAKLQVVVCLVRYTSYGGSSPTPRGCSTSVCFLCTGITGYTDAFCNYTTYLYVWRVSSYAIATINGGTYRSPSVLSNATVGYCA